jgi:3-oxoacyl-[acyl-carrier-protein] synthase II
MTKDSKQHKVVITGLGIVSAFGDSVDDFWQAIKQGNSAVKSWQPEGAEDFPVKYAAEIDFDSLVTKHQDTLQQAPLLERRGIFGLIAAQQAFKHAGLTEKNTLGITACSGVPEVDAKEVINLNALGPYPQNLQKHQPEQYSGLAVANDSMVTAIAQELKCTGPVLNINGACAGAAQAIGMAYQAIKRGEVSTMLAGGADSVLNTRVMTGLFLLGATATSSPKKERLCCPFDSNRSGLVAGEGAAFLVLESEASALARGATIYAEVLGYGSTLDAHKVTAPHPEGHGAVAVMKNALKDADLQPHQIDYINAHGTSTPLNDVIETRAIKKVFAQESHNYPLISSTKSMIGHWISAAPAPEALATILAIYHDLVPPTINLETADVDCDLDYVAQQAKSAKINYALSNSFGFGGINSCIAFGAFKNDT